MSVARVIESEPRPSQIRLSEAMVGDRAVILDVQVQSTADNHGVEGDELQRRLLEFGFVEGAVLEVIHEGVFGRDPIVVRLNEMRIALRRRDAQDVIIELESGGA
jgi:ferrous iron transport protein A